MLAIARQVSESLDAVQIKLKPGYFVGLFREIGKILQTPLEISDVEFSVATYRKFRPIASAGLQLAA